MIRFRGKSSILTLFYVISHTIFISSYEVSKHLECNRWIPVDFFPSYSPNSPSFTHKDSMISHSHPLSPTHIRHPSTIHLHVCHHLCRFLHNKLKRRDTWMLCPGVSFWSSPGWISLQISKATVAHDLRYKDWTPAGYGVTTGPNVDSALTSNLCSSSVLCKWWERSLWVIMAAMHSLFVTYNFLQCEVQW